jgi:hypothetical protein
VPAAAGLAWRQESLQPVFTRDTTEPVAHRPPPNRGNSAPASPPRSQSQQATRAIKRGTIKTQILPPWAARPKEALGNR